MQEERVCQFYKLSIRKNGDIYPCCLAKKKSLLGNLFDKNIKGQMKQADRCGAAYALILGGDELAKQMATLKDLTTGEQKQIPFAEVVSEVKKVL